MKIKAVLFDLDGTLLSMNQDHFIETYLRGLAAHLAPHGYDPKLFAKALWTGTGAVIKNNGRRKSKTLWTENEEGETARVYEAEEESGEARYIAHTIKGLGDRG